MLPAPLQLRNLTSAFVPFASNPLGKGDAGVPCAWLKRDAVSIPQAEVNNNEAGFDGDHRRMLNKYNSTMHVRPSLLKDRVTAQNIVAIQSLNLSQPVSGPKTAQSAGALS